MVLGSKEWLVAMRSGEFDRRPPVPWEPPPKWPAKPRPARWEPALPICDPPPTRKRQSIKELLINGEIGSANLKYIGYPCCYCGDPMIIPTRDHVYPRHRGGSRAKHNIMMVCRYCNQDKGGKTLDEFADWLERKADKRVERIKHLSKQTPDFWELETRRIMKEWDRKKSAKQRS